MTDWYHWFLLCALILWTQSTPQDRSALRILLIASLASEVITELVTDNMPYAESLVIPCSVEILTAFSFLRWAKNRTGYMQIRILAVAWIAHILCYVDTWLKTDLVYSRYEIIIQMVAAGQLAACNDTLFSIAGRIRSFINSFRVGCSQHLFPARHRAGLLPSGRPPRH
jgi:hypothetical protein